VVLQLGNGKLSQITDLSWAQDESQDASLVRYFQYQGEDLTNDSWAPYITTFDYGSGGLSSVIEGSTIYGITSAAARLFLPEQPVYATWGLPTPVAAFGQATVTGLTGDVIKYLLDARGRALEVDQRPWANAQNPLSSSESWQRNAAGDVTVNTDPDHKVTTYTYDYSNADLLGITYPDGSQVTYTYDPIFHSMTSSEDENGNTTTYNYNTLDELTSVTNALNQTTTYTYYDGVNAGLVKTVQGPDTSHGLTTYVYDSNRRVSSVQDAAGNRTTSTYDSWGNLLTVTNALNQITTTVYDSQGRLIRQIDATGATTSYAYSAAGFLTQTTDPLKHETTEEYDSRGLLVKKIEAEGNKQARQTVNKYDNIGELTLVTTSAVAEDPTYNHPTQTQYAYDALGRKTDEYDLVSATLSYWQHTHWTYDDDGDVRSVTTGEMDQYDSGWQPVSSLSNVTITSYAYDARGRVTATYEGWHYVHLGVTYAARITYTKYDKAGNVIQVDSGNSGLPLETSPPLTGDVQSGRSVTTYAYDKLNRVIEKTAAAGTPDATVTLTKYDLSGNIIGVTTGLVPGYTTDSDGNIVIPTPLAAAPYAHPSTTSYAYDKLNRQTGVLMGYTPDGKYLSGTSYAYDAIGDLISETSGLSTAPLGIAHTTVTSYAYDAVGRRTLEMENYNSVFFGLGSFATYDSATKWAYDADGNLLSVTTGDSTNRTPHVSTTIYGYDALNRQTLVEVGYTKEDASSTTTAGP
jgi:YD repeat-containing protein